MEETKIETIIEEVKRLDPKLKQDDEGFLIATILLSGLVVGANSEAISKFLGISLDKVEKYEKNLVKNKIWVKGKTQCEWFDKDGTIALWMDVAVAQGYMEKRSEKPAKKLGKRGGQATSKKYGKEHFSEAGKKGMKVRWGK